MYSGGSFLRSGSKRANFWLDPSDDVRFYVQGASDNDLYFVENWTHDRTPVPMNLRSAYPDDPIYFEINALAIDPLESRNIYVTTRTYGMDDCWWGRWNDDFSKIEWTAISSADVHGSATNPVFVHPLTSEVIFSTNQGTWVRPALDGRLFKDSIYERAADLIRPRAKFPPRTTVLPSIAGDRTPTGTLTVNTGAWAAQPSPTFSFQWKRNDVVIKGATAREYVKTPLDAGQILSCSVTAENTEGTAMATTLNWQIDRE